MERLINWMKHHFREVAKTKTTTNSIAWGAALGTFISILPTPGFSVLIGLILVLIFSRINKFAIFIAMAVWNPLVTTPLYFLSYRIGDSIFKGVPADNLDLVFLDQAFNFTRRFLLGNLILAISLSILTFCIVYLIVRSIRTSSSS